MNKIAEAQEPWSVAGIRVAKARAAEHNYENRRVTMVTTVLPCTLQLSQWWLPLFLVCCQVLQLFYKSSDAIN